MVTMKMGGKGQGQSWRQWGPWLGVARFSTLWVVPLLYGQRGVSMLLLAAQSCLTLCDPMDCSSPGYSVLGILQARTLERVAIPFSRGSSQARDRTHVSCIGRWILYH